jgi:hypothetical protein
MDIASVVPMPLQLCTLLGSAGHDSSLWRIEVASNSERSASMGDTAIQIRSSSSVTCRSAINGVAYNPVKTLPPNALSSDLLR